MIDQNDKKVIIDDEEEKRSESLSQESLNVEEKSDGVLLKNSIFLRYMPLPLIKKAYEI
jgi:hypothetical protein